MCSKLAAVTAWSVSSMCCCLGHLAYQAMTNAACIARLHNNNPLHGAWYSAGRSHLAPLVAEMLQRIQAEVARYERVVTYWPSFGPSLEGAVCAALRTTTAAVSRQCGLMPVLDVSTVWQKLY